jgi:hypothetical protein
VACERARIIHGIECACGEVRFYDSRAGTPDKLDTFSVDTARTPKPTVFGNCSDSAKTEAWRFGPAPPRRSETVCRLRLGHPRAVLTGPVTPVVNASKNSGGCTVASNEVRTSAVTSGLLSVIFPCHQGPCPMFGPPHRQTEVLAVFLPLFSLFFSVF